MNNKVKINDTEISIKEYNRLYAGYNPEHPVLLEYKKLYKILFGSDDIGKKPAGMDELEWRLSEYKKSGGTNLELFGDLRRRVNQEIPTTGATSLWETDDPNSENVKNIIQKTEELFNKKKEFVELGKQLFKQRQENPTPEPDQTQEEKNREAEELQQNKESAIQEINSALNEEPQINSSELENSVWQSNIEYSKKKEEVNRYKEEILADIKVKRAIKKSGNSNDKLAVFKQEAIHDVNIKKNAAGLTNEDLDKVNHSWESEIMEADNKNRINLIKARVLTDIRNRKGKNDQEKKQAEELAKRFGQATQAEVSAMEESQLEESMKLFTRWEGENEYKITEATAEEIEKRLMETNPELYRETIVNALQARIHDYGIGMNEVDENIRKVIQGEITDVNQIKTIKERAIKEIGEVGAKKKWTDLINQAKTLLTKAKQKVTEQIKKDIQIVQGQIKSFKGGANSYLTSFYQSDQTEIEKTEQALSNYLTAEQMKPKGTPWGIIIPVSLVVVALIGVVGVVIVRKRKQARIKK